MDELLNQAEITIKLFKETFESSTKDNDLLEVMKKREREAPCLIFLKRIFIAKAK